jgi:uncharacterized protein (DUF697 family)
MASDIDEQLIAQIVLNESGLDKALGSVISSVWAAGRKDSFMASLNKFIKDKDGEIEAVSQQNYQVPGNAICSDIDSFSIL